VPLVDDHEPNAIHVPQRAVTELLGKQFVTVIGANDKAEQRAVTLGDRVGQMVIVKAGLSAGERIVVDGLTKAPPGTTVAPTMITEAQLDNPPPPQVGRAPGGGPQAPGSNAAPKAAPPNANAPTAPTAK
jgi:membrane fusion protein (multidrug efflux system)